MDALRFLAAAAVVAYHYRGAIETELLAWFLQGMFSRAFQFVDLFFVLSGFIIAAVYSDRLSNFTQFGQFMIKRFARLWPLHVLLLALYLGIWGASVAIGLPLNDASKYDASCIIPNVLMVHSLPVCSSGLTFNYVSWSISAEMFMYLLAPVVLLVSRRPLALLLIAAIVFVGLALIPTDRPWQLWTYDWGVARALPAFALGVALFNVRGRLAIPAPHLMTLAAIAVFFALSCTTAPLWASLLVTYLIAVCAAAADAKGDVPAWVGRLANFSPLTYGLYMWHPILFTVGVSFVVKRALPVSGIASDVMVLAVAIGAGVVAYFSLVWFETPMRRLIATSRTPPTVDAPSTP